MERESNEETSVTDTIDNIENNFTLINNIIEKLDHVPPFLPTSYIHRVHPQLRTINDKAYDPMLISIGPYHYDKRKSDLQYMEDHKLRYLNDLIKRKEEDGVSKVVLLNTYFEVLDKVEDRARGYYSEAITLEKNDFREMLLLDGCFIIEFFRKYDWADSLNERETDPLFKASWIANALSRDLTLVENQIPFFVLKVLHTIIDDDPDPLFLMFAAVSFLPIYIHLPEVQREDEWLIARQSISNLVVGGVVPMPLIQRSRRLNRKKLNDMKHLLDLVRKFMLMEETLSETEESCHGSLDLVRKFGSCPQVWKNLVGKWKNLVGKRKNLLDLVRKFGSCPQEEETLSETENGTIQDEEGRQEPVESSHGGSHKYTYSATELRELGVGFKCVKKAKFYDIKFVNGILKIPIIQIEDGTEALFRNLIAYEQHACSDDILYVGDYMAFMDGLIDSPKDVQLLRHLGIIRSLMSDDEAIATMFNKMHVAVMLPREFYYQKIVHDLLMHCKRRRHGWMATLWRTYLNSPWTILSVAAASLLLISTIMQTVYTALSYYKPDSHFHQ